MAEEPKSGTTAQEGGDAQAAGTPDAADRDAGQEPDYKTMYLEAKSKVEEANRLEAENKALRERQAQEEQRTQPAASVAGGSGLGESFEDTKRLALGDPARNIPPDPVAVLVLENLLQTQLARVPSDYQDEVQQRFLKGGFRDVNHARETIERERALAAASAKDAEIARLKAELEAKGRNTVNNVPGSTAREGPQAPASNVKTMTRAEWQQDQARLSDSERRAQQLARLTGKLKVEGD